MEMPCHMSGGEPVTSDSPPLRTRSPVDAKIFAYIDIDTMRGLEIGALHNPRLPVDHPNSRFLDHATADELRAKYAEDPPMAAHLDEIVDVDYVWHPGMRLRDAVGSDAPFDFVVAAHLIEHIPNPIGWFQQVAEILRPGGIASLVVPDKRFCFDARRDVTVAARWVDAYLRDLDQPSYEQIYDAEANRVVGVDTATLWSGIDPAELVRQDVEDPDMYAYLQCLARRDQAAFIDVHCSTFTPESFVELFDTVVRLGLVPFEIVEVFPTELHALEFHVSLARPGDPTTPRRRAKSRGISPPTDTQRSFSLSRREIRMVMAKRRVMKAVRSLRRRVSR
jgi:SAM-dependent methyltransferase